jgi:hypothetical protein
MSSEETPQQPGQPQGEGAEQELSPEQEQMLRQMEEEMRRVRVQDLVAQSVVSILNLSARRIVKEDERDLEQAQHGIDVVRAIVDLLDPEAAQEVRNALSQLQMLYAKTAGESGGGAPPAGGSGPAPGPGGGEPGIQTPKPPGLWVPGQG